MKSIPNKFNNYGNKMNNTNINNNKNFMNTNSMNMMKQDFNNFNKNNNVGANSKNNIYSNNKKYQINKYTNSKEDDDEEEEEEEEQINSNIKNQNQNINMNKIQKDDDEDNDEEEENNSINNINNKLYTTKSVPKEQISETDQYDIVFLPKYHSPAANKARLIKEEKTSDGKIIRDYQNRKEIIFPNIGLRKEIYDDGYQISYFKNKDIKQLYPDGTEVYLYAENHTVATSFPNGLKVCKFAGLLRKINENSG